MRDLIRQVTEDLAPEESRVLAALDGFGDAEALRRLTAGPGRDQRLGFGLDEAVALTSAIAWVGVDEAVRRIVDATADKAVRERRRWRPFSRRRKPEPAAAAVPALSAAAALPEISANVSQASKRILPSARQGRDTGSCREDTALTRSRTGSRCSRVEDCP